MALFSFGYSFQILMYFIQRTADVTRQFGKSSDTTSVLKQDIIWSCFPGTMSRWLLTVSKDGDYTTSLGNLCHFSVILTVKRVVP